jgi:hypothetical protein
MKFEVQVYYSGFCTYEIEADSEESAIEKARQMPVNQKEILANLENWEEADTAEQQTDSNEENRK